MEEVPGIAGGVPKLAPFPPTEIRQTLPPGEWQSCLEAWILCVEFRLRLLPNHFIHFKHSQTSSGVSFLTSYFLSWDFSQDQSSAYRPLSAKEHQLHRDCLLLLRRLLLETATPYDCSAGDLFSLLANASAAFGSRRVWIDTLQRAWQRQEKPITAALEGKKTSLIKMMATGDKKSVESSRPLIGGLTNLAKCLPEAGKFFMTGHDYIESLTSFYNDLPGKLHAADDQKLRFLLTESLFVCLRSLMASLSPETSVLLDNLYGLQANAEAGAQINPNRPTLLSSLVCLTTFVHRLEVFLATSSNSRGDALLQFLRSYKTKMSYLHPLPRVQRSRRGAKGKAKADRLPHEINIHKAAQISQIQELFPDTPTSYVLRLLNHFSDDIEAVTAALLEPESLPLHLQKSDLSVDYGNRDPAIDDHLTPSSTPPFASGRKNVFDDDDFDRLQVSTSKVHIGRRERKYEEPSDPSEKAKKKAAIMAALAAFDSDDDERDDTYDVADVGGAVDNTVDTDARPKRGKTEEHQDTDAHEEILFKAWTSHPQMFARDSKTRFSPARRQLKDETGMSDEQIEGWALMLSRDDANAQKLANKYLGPASFGGQQSALATTRWSASRSGTATEEETDSEAEGGNRSARGSFPNRTRSFRGGRGNGRGRGSTSGPSTDPGTQKARKRKEQGRGRGGANHNRREGRARKMGRGFGSVPTG